MAAIVVVGGSMAGLAAAARLAKLGHSVTLCERSYRLGGRLSSGNGPVTMTLPAAVRDLFRKSGRPLERELELLPVETPRRHVFDDGTVLDLPLTERGGGRDVLATTFDPKTADAWTRLIDDCVPLWELLRKQVLEAPYRGLRAFGAPGLVRLAPWRSFRTLARRLQDPRARAVLAATALGPGADPARAPGFLVVQAYVERTFGRWTCVGGLRPLVDALTRRLEERRVTVRYDTEITRIDVEAGAVTGVRVADGATHAADVVVAAVPVAELLTEPETSSGHRSRGGASGRTGQAVGSRIRVVDVARDDEPFETIFHDQGLVQRNLGGPPDRELGTSETHVRALPYEWRKLAPNRTSVHGLFRVGATARPGPGLPYELLGAALVAGEVGSLE